MKKITGLCVVLIICAIVSLGTVRNFYSENSPDYKIHQCLITGADNFKRVNLKVIVNVNTYELNQMFDTIRKEYIELNGEPDILYIELFDGQYAFENEECSGIKKYER